MLIWILELIFIIILMKFIEEIGFVNSCLIFGLVNGLCQLSASAGLLPIVSAFISGVIMGGLAYIGAKIFLFLIDLLGAIGYVLVVAFFILALIAIIL